jgi:predicted ATPase with chaperone activity
MPNFRHRPLTTRLPTRLDALRAAVEAQAAAAHILATVSMTAVKRGFLSLGQSVARATALRAAAAGRLQRTLLVHGPAGSGKGAFVDDLLALLFCQDGDAATRPCNV